MVARLADHGLDYALHALRRGSFVLLHDSNTRENEVDMVMAGELFSAEHAKIMRTDAGGLLCLALGHDVGEKLGLPTMRDVLRCAVDKFPVLQFMDEEIAPYGDPPAFSITVNHRKTFTGVTDHDRALTIRELARLSTRALNGGEDRQEMFASEFRTPGHVHLLLESKGSLAERRGHTELSVYLCRLAGLMPAAAICEMLDGKKHNALSTTDAKTYARRHSIPLLDGQQVVSSFLQQNHQTE